MNRENFAFGKINFILLAVGVLVIILGFILMSGSSSSETTFNPEIFSANPHKKWHLSCVLSASFQLYSV